MSYIEKVLLPGESIIITSRIHWIIYSPASLLFWKASALLAVYLRYAPNAWPLLASALFIYAMAAASFGHAWFTRWITEFGVTNLRVIYKKGFIWRQTVEMNMDKVESVRVDQSTLGRLLGYGTLHIQGVGQGIEHLKNITAPLTIRSAIIANESPAVAARLHLEHAA